MEIIGESAHRMLAYVEAVRIQGHTRFQMEFKAYSSGWDQKFTLSPRDAELADLTANVGRMASVAVGNGRKQLEPNTVVRGNPTYTGEIVNAEAVRADECFSLRLGQHESTWHHFANR